MNADKQGERRSWNGVCPVCLFLLVCDCPLTRLLSTALFAPFTRFLADPLGAEESQTCLIRHRRRRSLSAFIRVHPRLLLLVCLGSGGRKEKKWGYELEFCGGGFWTGSGLYGDRGAGAGGAAGQVRLRGAGVRERGGAAAAVPGADSAGDSVYGGGGAGGGGDAEPATGGALPPGSGRDGSGEAGGGSVAAGGAGRATAAGGDYRRPDGDEGPRVLPGSEAGLDHRATVGVTARGFADRREAAVRAETGGRTGSGGSEDIAGGERAIRGVAGRDARRPGVRGGAGVLERAEGLPERATGERPLVDEHSTGRCGEDVQIEEGGGGKAEWPRMNADEHG